LSEDDVRWPKLFRQIVPQRWLGDGKTTVTELVDAVLSWPSTFDCQQTAEDGGQRR